ncbi:RNA polymerase sigma factor RpoH [Bradyrhizobium genosp. A]|uniref:RNA polymerase sigma factor RpoH n=1 Tax=Bradyrhizobium genosp. A TaxID=83626 RepID=UPI003CF49EA5
MSEHEISTNGSGLASRSLTAPFADSPGSGYFAGIRRFALLEREQEYQLAKRWREHGDRDAADKIVTSHLRLAAKIAMNYRGYGLPISELVSEGNVGLMKAVHRFEPDMGFRFSTYAIWWIKASIQDYILRSWSLVKIGTTGNQKKLFFKLRSAKARIAALDNGNLRPEQVTAIATALGVTAHDVADMNVRLAGDTSLNASVRSGDEASEWQDHLVDDSPSPETIVLNHDEMDHRQKTLVRAMAVLDDRERRIFEARHLLDEPRTLDDLAIEFNLSRERIRQIEVRAYQRVQISARRSEQHRQAAGRPQPLAAAKRTEVPQIR